MNIPNLRMGHYCLLVCCFVFMIFLRCMMPSNAGNSSEVTNGVILGFLYYENGQPAGNIDVSLYPQNDTVTTARVKTDDQGKYAIRLLGIDTGTYNILGDAVTSVVFINNIKINTFVASPLDTTTIQVPNDTLKSPGTISGISHMVGQSDSSQVRVMLYIYGIGIGAKKPEIGGFFRYNSIPEGNYTLVIDPVIDKYKMKFVDVSVTAGAKTSLGTINLHPMKKPVVHADGDTVVTINDTILLDGEAFDEDGIIVRREWDIGNTGVFTVTDSTGDTSFYAPDTQILHFPCIFRATDNDSNSVSDTLYINIMQDIPHVFITLDTPQIDTVIGLNDTLRLLGNVVDMGTVVKWKWKFGNSAWIETSGNDTTIITPSSPQTYICSVGVTDEDGLSGYGSLSLIISSLPPTVDAGNDTTVGFHDTVYLYGNAHDNGTITKWEWKFGNNPWITTSSGDTVITAPSEPQIYICSLRVTDDDAETACDTVAVTVISSPPIVDPGNDTAVGINDTVMFHAAASDNGKIVKWEWKFGDYPWTETSGGDTVLIAPPQPQSWICSVRVTDNNLQTAAAQVIIDIALLPPVADAGNDTVVAKNSIVMLRGSRSKDSLGTIIAYEWDLGGSGAFITCTTGDTDIVAPGQIMIDGYPCILRVTDDDGTQDVDTMLVRVFSFNQAAVLPDTCTSLQITSSFVFDDKLWILCGSNILYSSDGVTWQTASGSAPFPTASSYYCSAVHNDKVWLIDNSSAAYSADGAAWITVTDSVSLPRKSNHTLTRYKDRLWVIAGYTATSFPPVMNHEVWSGSNGYDWELTKKNPGFSKRSDHSSVAFDGRVWIIGGKNSSGAALNDVWYSSDGVNWSESAAAIPFSARYGHSSIVHDNKIWIIGGITSQYDDADDVWVSPNGSDWIYVLDLTATDFFNNRHLVNVFRNSLYIIGLNKNQKIEVWRLE